MRRNNTLFGGLGGPAQIRLDSFGPALCAVPNSEDFNPFSDSVEDDVGCSGDHKLACACDAPLAANPGEEGQSRHPLDNQPYNTLRGLRIVPCDVVCNVV